MSEKQIPKQNEGSHNRKTYELAGVAILAAVVTGATAGVTLDKARQHDSIVEAPATNPGHAPEWVDDSGEAIRINVVNLTPESQTIPVRHDGQENDLTLQLSPQ